MSDLFSHNIYKRARLNRTGTSAKRSLKQSAKEPHSSYNKARIHDEGSWMNALSSNSRKEEGTEKRAQYQQKTLDGFFGRSPSCAKSTTSENGAQNDADISMNEDPLVRTQEENEQQEGVEYHPLSTPLDNLLQWRNASAGLTKELTDILYQCETAKALLHYLPQLEQTTEFEIDELGDSDSEEGQPQQD